MKTTITNAQISTTPTLAIGFIDPVSEKKIFILKHQFENPQNQQQQEKYFLTLNPQGGRFTTGLAARTFKRNFNRVFDKNQVEDLTGLSIDFDLAKQNCKIIDTLADETVTPKFAQPVFA